MYHKHSSFRKMLLWSSVVLLMSSLFSLIMAQSSGVLREVWNNITGTSVSALTGNPAYPNSPSSQSNISLFEGPTNSGDNYGARYRGYVTPPTTGSYTFWIAGDDDCELWISTDATAANRVKIASVTGYTNSRQWTKYTSQQSTSRTLTAGERYYIEALHKDGTQNDNLAVGWQGPGISGDAERPIPSNRLVPWTNTQLSLTITNDTHGTTTPSGTVTLNAGVAQAISAVPSSGYQFSNWTVTSGIATIANASLAATTVTLSSVNATVRANFAAVTYTLSMTNDGHGTTTPTGTVNVGSGVATSISATSASGYQFLNWTVTTGTATIANASSAATTVTLNGGNATVRANFAAVTYTLSMTNDGHGTTTPTGTVNVGSGVATSISATAASGYQFLNWTVTTGTATIANASSAATTVTLNSGNATVRANFATITYALSMTNDGHGTTTPTGTVNVGSGVATTISATAASGYQFLNWTVTTGTATITNASSDTTTVTLNSGNATVRANFATVTYALSMTNDGHGTTTPTGTVSVGSGVATSISATAASGYQFLNWTVTNGTATIANASSAATTVTLNSGNATVRANFATITYVLSMTNDGHGTTTPTGTVNVGSGVATTISATAANGYQFLNWAVTSGTATIANASSAATTVTLNSGNATVRANFNLNQPSTPNNRRVAVSGTLYDQQGNPVGTPSPDTVDVSVKLMSAKAGGDTLYSETFLIQNGQGVVVDNGNFVVTLGSGFTSGNLMAVFAENANCFAEITILGATPDVLLPRTPVTASPYSLSVPTANSAVLHGDGYPVDKNIEAAVGAYYVNDNDGTTWLRVNTGWKNID